MRFAVCSLVGFFLVTDVSHALDLTPITALERGGEGGTYEVIHVTDGAKKYRFVPPPGWLVNGSGKSLSLTAGDRSQAWIKLTIVPRPQEDDVKPAAATSQPQDQQTAADDLQKWVMQFIPGGAADVAFVKRVESPYTVLTHPSIEFIFSFTSYGSKDLISISVVDFSASQRLVTLASSDKKDFDRVRPAAIAMMFSWQEARKKE